MPPPYRLAKTIVFVAIYLCNNLTVLSAGTISKATTSPPLPFNPCNPEDLQCFRAITRTLLQVMESNFNGMTPIDPYVIQSITLAFPDYNISYSLRKAWVHGGSWVDLVDKTFNKPPGVSSSIVKLDLQVVGTLHTKLPIRDEYIKSRITINIRNAVAEMAYPFQIVKKLEDGETYLLIGDEEIDVDLTENANFFFDIWQPSNDQIKLVENSLRNKPDILNSFAGEIVRALVQEMIQNLRLFTSRVPMRHYYALDLNKLQD